MICRVLYKVVMITSQKVETQKGKANITHVHSHTNIHPKSQTCKSRTHPSKLRNGSALGSGFWLAGNPPIKSEATPPFCAGANRDVWRVEVIGRSLLMVKVALHVLSSCDIVFLKERNKMYNQLTKWILLIMEIININVHIDLNHQTTCNLLIPGFN